jgi:membrane AbrB-like protein
MRSVFTKTPSPAKLLLILTTGLIAIPGGLLFHFLHLPLPWMLGPLSITLIFNACSGNRACWSVHFRNAGLIVIGYSMGRSVVGETTEQMIANLPLMATVTALTVLFCMGVGYLTYLRTDISLASGILGNIPGGLAQMVLMGEEIEGADVTAVTFMQIIRVLTVVFIVPFIATYGIAHPSGAPLVQTVETSRYSLAVLQALIMALAGAWLAACLKMPIPFLLGPIFTAAAASLLSFPVPPVPSLPMSAAQLLFGTYMGTIVSLEKMRRFGNVLPYAIGGSAALVAFTYLIGFGLTWVTPCNLITAFLSASPGGLTEMGIVALSVGADVAFVVAFHLFRLFSILLVLPPLLRLRFKR